MQRMHEEARLAARLCSELLSATDLKEVCRTRGFPVHSGAKQNLARAVAARFLDPLGVPEAMSRIEGVWLRALHLIAAAEGPVALDALADVVDPKAARHSPDFRSLWRKISTELLARGVLLADELGEPGAWEKSRFARFRLFIPSDFRRFLPPFPGEAEPLRGSGERMDVQGVLRPALAAFILEETEGKVQTKASRSQGPQTLVARLAAQLSIEEGRLELRGLDGPSGERLARRLAACWEDGLARRKQRRKPISAGRMAHHILGHLPPAHGCAPAVLAAGLASTGFEVDHADVALFCEEGLGAGILRRFKRPGGEALYALVGPRHVPDEAGALVVVPQARGVRVDVDRSSLLGVLEAAAVSRASICGGTLVLEPDLVRMGRVWDRLEQSPALATLRTRSPAFDAAARGLESRRGQVIVHRGVAVLRVTDVGLHALIQRRFGAAVREIGREHLAALPGKVEEIVAFARNEGYVARRLP